MPERKLVNQSELARKKGVTRQAVKKAISEGRLPVEGSGRAARIDLNHPLTLAWLRTPSTPGKALGPPLSRPQGKPAEKKKAEPSPKPKDKEPPEENGRRGLPSNEEDLQEFLQFTSLKNEKLQEELNKVRLDNQKKRGELIERTLVQKFIHGIHEIDNGQWKTLGLKISSDVAAVLGIDEDEKVRSICDLIDKEVMGVLNLIKREQNSFLIKLGAEKIAPTEKAA